MSKQHVESQSLALSKFGLVALYCGKESRLILLSWHSIFLKFALLFPTFSREPQVSCTSLDCSTAPVSTVRTPCAIFMTPCIGLNRVKTADLLLSPTLTRMQALRFPVPCDIVIRTSGVNVSRHCLDQTKRPFARVVNCDLHDVPRAAVSRIFLS